MRTSFPLFGHYRKGLLGAIQRVPSHKQKIEQNCFALMSKKFSTYFSANPEIIEVKDNTDREMDKILTPYPFLGRFYLVYISYCLACFGKILTNILYNTINICKDFESFLKEKFELTMWIPRFLFPFLICHIFP
jgi:hypothetical protein